MSRIMSIIYLTVYLNKYSKGIMMEIRDILNILESSYSKQLNANNNVVTTDEYVSHRHILEAITPLIRQLRDVTHDLNRYGVLDNNECELLQSAEQLLSRIAVPLSLLTVKDKPKLKLPKL